MFSFFDKTIFGRRRNDNCTDKCNLHDLGKNKEQHRQFKVHKNRLINGLQLNDFYQFFSIKKIEYRVKYLFKWLQLQNFTNSYKINIARTKCLLDHLVYYLHSMESNIHQHNNIHESSYHKSSMILMHQSLHTYSINTMHQSLSI